MKKKFAILGLFAFLFVSCSKERIDISDGFEIDVKDSPEVLIVDFEDSETRVQLQNHRTVWTKDDQVSVFYLSNANQRWKYTGETGSRTAELRCIDSGVATEKLNKVVVVYPFNDNYYINPETCGVKAYMPAVQTYLKDSYGLDGNIMISSGYYNQFSLKNVCGWLELRLTGNGEQIESITLYGNNNEQVAGEIYIDSSDATCVLASEMGDVADENGANSTGGVGGALVFDDTILEKVTLNCVTSAPLSGSVTSFYIALPPQKFSNGFTVEIKSKNGARMVKSTNNEVLIQRNNIVPMTAFNYDGIVPEVFDLAYVTNDGCPLDPYVIEGFGADFLENSYDPSSGKGLLKFDGKVTSIPENAFIGCTNLVSMDIPVGLGTIGRSAYNGCTSLTYMNIPQGTHTIDNKAFYGCSGMKEITIPSSVRTIGVSSFEGCAGKATINCAIGSASSSANGKFQKAKFTEVVIGDGVTYVGSWAFYACTQLLSVVVPESLTTFYGDAFTDCASITDVYISDLSKWCNSKFYEGHVIGGCYANPLHKGAALWLNGEKITDLVIPSDVTTINDRVFCGCNCLTNVRLHDEVIAIKPYAFEDCKSIASINIPSNITEIGKFAFYGCSSLKKVYISDLAAWCKIIFDTQYANPMNNNADLYLDDVLLTNLQIPSNVIELKDNVFYGCRSITSVELPNRIASIGSMVFNNCANLAAFSGKFASEDSRCLIVDGVLKVCAPAGLTDYSIPDVVTEISPNAFTSCTSLINIDIHDGVTKIGQQAFYGCRKLETVTIGRGITDIGYQAFYGSSVLMNVFCKALNPPIISGDYAFKEYIYGRNIYVPEESVSSYKSRWYKYSSYIVGYDFGN